jgi:hypothetical protein
MIKNERESVMILQKPYNRIAAREYAKRWALSRNPLFFDYTGIGGNCTNFVSQCVLAGSCQMNLTPVFGWYYLSEGARTASWTGVEFFYNFITQNKGVGPYGREVLPYEAMLGDVIQLGRTEDGYYHTLLIVGFADNTYLVAAQSDDAYERPLDTYNYDYARFIHIEGVRFDAIDSGECFLPLLSGEALLIGGRVVRENTLPPELPSEKENPPAEPSTPEMPLPTPSLPPDEDTPPSSAEAP